MLWFYMDGKNPAVNGTMMKDPNRSGCQILGKNRAAAGHGTVTEFVMAMFRSTEEQCGCYIDCGTEATEATPHGAS